MEPLHSSTEKSVVHCRQTGILPGAGSVLHLHNFEALSAKNLKCAIFIGVFVNHDCAVSRLFLAGMRGDTRPLKATDTIRHVTSGPMAFTMEDPNFFHAASLLSIAKSNSASVNHSRFDMPAAMTRLLLSAFARRSSRQSCSKRRSLLCLPKTSSGVTECDGCAGGGAMFAFLTKFMLVVRSRLKSRARLEAEILVLNMSRAGRVRVYEALRKCVSS